MTPFLWTWNANPEVLGESSATRKLGWLVVDVTSRFHPLTLLGGAGDFVSGFELSAESNFFSPPRFKP